MALKTKAQLKDVFNGPASLLYQEGAITVSTNQITLNPTMDVPVKVDTIEFEQGEPSIEHYKVIGLTGDWVSSAEAGDFSISFRVPTKHTDIMKMAFGVDAVSTISTGSGSDASYQDFSGDGIVLKSKKVQGTWIIMNDAQNQMMIINNTALYASIVMDNDAKGVIAIDFSGTIESDGSNPDIFFLKKAGSTSS